MPVPRDYADALEWAADAIRERDGGNAKNKSGWKSDEALAHWLTIRSLLADGETDKFALRSIAREALGEIGNERV